MTLGDSVTEGFGSTPDMNQRWPNLLAERLQSNRATSQVAVLNAGVSGNRVLHDFLGTSALARFDRDVLVQTGVKYVIVLEGNADFLIPGLIGNPAEDVTADADHPGASPDDRSRPCPGIEGLWRHVEPGRRLPVPRLLDGRSGGETPGRQPLDPDQPRL